MRLISVLSLALPLACCAALPVARQNAAAQCEPTRAALTDLHAARDAVRDHMIYPLGGLASVDAAVNALSAQAASARSEAEHLRVMEAFVFALGDHHAHLGTNDNASPRLVPTGASVWVEFRGDQWVITQVRPESPARRQGLREGMVVTEVNGAAPTTLGLPPLTPASHDEMAAFAMRVALAGNHVSDAIIVARGANGVVEARLSLEEEPDRGLASLSYPAPGIALIRIHNSLGDSGLPAVFDGLMRQASGARVVMLDLRDTPSGGDSEIAKPIMSWFVHGERGYQRHRDREREWVEQVTGRTDAFSGAVLVLADHWTGSMGEGIAVGLRAAANARIVGTPMAGLRGAIDSFHLPCLDADLRIPTERIFAMDRQPRERALPDIAVSESELANSGDGDAILAAALRNVSAR